MYFIPLGWLLDADGVTIASFLGKGVSGELFVLNLCRAIVSESKSFDPFSATELATSSIPSGKQQ